MAKTLLIAMGTLALALLAGPALADGMNPPRRCHCHVVHHHHRVPPPPRERIVYVPVPPPPCDGRWERDEHGDWACVMPPPEVEDISLSSDFFADSGGVGPDTVIFEGGGGGGGFAQASASASAFASASAHVSINFRGGFGHHMTPPHGCGCGGGHHGKW